MAIFYAFGGPTADKAALTERQRLIEHGGM
jgi:hypothetical protein